MVLEKTKAVLDANGLPAVGGGTLGGAVPHLVDFLYKQVPSMADFMPQATFLSLVLIVGVWAVSKMDLRWSSEKWLVRG